jgi:Cft2 family RNA processing exonuclease
MKIGDLWIDPKGIKGEAFVSHAHGDHLRAHRRIYATRETIELSKVRISKKFEGIPLNYYESFTLNGKRVTLFPAGHILGAAQILIEGDERILYSGDFDYYSGFTREKIVVPSADTLIMDATYGSPEFIFPRRDDVISDFIEWVISAKSRGFKPVIYVYPIGKAQEVIKALELTGYTVELDGKIYEATRVYESLGIDFEIPYTILGEGGDVLLLSTGKLGKMTLPRDSLTAYLTGWAVKYHFPTHKTFPLSDHADFVDLLGYVEEVNPKRVHLINDRFGFGKYLSKRGIELI